jgi:AraC family transcriptional regulator
MYLVADETGVLGKHKSLDGNIVMYSSCKTIDARLAFKNFSIKYVSEGDEIYRLKDHEFVVKNNQYLLCNSKCEGSVLIDSKTQVNGICIDISNDIISEVIASYLAPDTFTADLSLDNFFHSDDFLERQFDAKGTHLGHQLNQLDHIIKSNPYREYKFEPEFYYRLSEGIISDYIPVVKQFRTLKCIKSETKKDLLRRLTKGKEFLDQNFTSEIDIEKVAVESNISQYHFFRLFKTVFGVSPYQYLKQKRLHKAQELLRSHQMPLAQLAIEVGYSDIFSFSKAFKQYFGFAPSKNV